jgi:hypothetical protein
MKAKLLVVYAKAIRYQNRKLPGEFVEGGEIGAFDLSASVDIHDKMGAFEMGAPPMSLRVPYEMAQKFATVPGYYDCDVVQVTRFGQKELDITNVGAFTPVSITENPIKKAANAG